MEMDFRNYSGIVSLRIKVRGFNVPHQYSGKALLRKRQLWKRFKGKK